MKKSLFNQKGVSGVLIIIIAAVFLIGVGAFVMMRRSPSSTSTTPSTATEHSTDAMTKEAVPTGDISGTYTDIVRKGQNLECDFVLPSSGEAPNPFGTGKLYTTGSKGRSMMSGNTSGMSMEASAIYKDETAYSWVKVGETTMGFKFDKEKMNAMSKDLTPQQIQQGEQFRAKMDFKCKPWTPDNSMFELPVGVEFK